MRKIYLPIIRVATLTNLLKKSLIALIFCISFINFWFTEWGIFSYTFNWTWTSFSVSNYCYVTWVNLEWNDSIYWISTSNGWFYRSQIKIRYWDNNVIPIKCFNHVTKGHWTQNDPYYIYQDTRPPSSGPNAHKHISHMRNYYNGLEIWSLYYGREESTDAVKYNMLWTWSYCQYWNGVRTYDEDTQELYSVGDLSLSCTLNFLWNWPHTITIEDPLYNSEISPSSWQITEISIWAPNGKIQIRWENFDDRIANYEPVNNGNAVSINEINWLPALERLNLWNNRLTSLSWLRNAQHIDSLEYTDLTNNPITSTSEQFYVKIQENTTLTPSKDFKRFWYSYKETSPKYKREIRNNQNEITESWIITGTNGRNEINNINIGNNFQWKFRVSILNNNSEAAYDEITIGIWNNEDSPSQEWPYDDEDSYLKKANINIRWLSWSIPLEAAHPWNTQSSHPSLDWILETTDIQNFTQNWYDLDLFLVDGEWNVWHHTIMDRNMWASEVYNKKFGLWNINTWSFGYRYQWWNNYWFKPCYTNWCSDFSENSDGVVVPYYLREYTYNEDWRNPLPYFAHNVWDDWYTIVDSVADYDLWTPPLSTRLQQLENLRWWIWDTYDGEWNYGEWNWTIVHNNTTRKRSRKWPCPDGYHVPSMNEWDKILVWWGYAKNKQIDIGDYYGSTIYWANEWKNFASDLLLPPTWYRRAQGYVWEQQWDIGEYRSSSPEEGGIAMKVPIGFPAISARGLEFDSTSIYEHSREVSHSSDEGKSVRCIKDSPDSELNIYPNGWTNAFVSVYKGKIIALWTPKRAWYTFEWWYRNEDFTGEKVKVWDSIGWRIESSNWSFTSIPHLDIYAKRKGNPKCTDLPSNATANNSKTPSSDTRYYYSSNTSLVCTFQCNPNYTWNSSTSSCEPTYQCTGTLPANSTKNNNLVPDRNTNYYYSTDISLACTFHCNTNYTWNSSTSSCQITPQTYTLTINYKYSDWSTASATVTETLIGWASYSVSSPIISNYTASTSVVKGTMPNSDKTIDVVYTKIQTTWWGWWWSSSSSSSNSTLEISVSPSSPDTYEWIKVTIETDDDYTDKVYFSKLQYRSSSSSSWSNISRTSSTYVSDYSSAWSNGYYKMTSSDDGEATLKNLVKFKKSGYYKIYVEDTDGNEDYIQIYVDNYNWNSSNTLEISVSPSSPDTYEWVKLNITTDDDYIGKINFSKFQYRSSSSSSWSNISRTSSTYVSDYSSTRSNGYYKMTSSDDGEATLKNLVKFKKSGYYRIYFEDSDGNESYVQINVDEDDESSSNENNNDSNLSLSVSDLQPKTYKSIDVTLKTDNYVGKIKLYAKYKNLSNSRIKISNNSSSEYFSDYSNIWENWYYKMTSSDKWKKVLYDLISFEKAWSYRIYAEDEQWYFNYITIEVTSTPYSSDEPNDGTQTNIKSNDYDIENMLQSLLNKDSQGNWNESLTETITDTSEEIYTARSCKQYKIEYNSSLWAFTSPNMQKNEYFINKDYLKRYIDSKNPQKPNCPVNSWWISSSYNDSSNNSNSFTAPNGKVYSISNKEWKYYSNNLTTNKSFATLVEIKNFIKSRNPLINMKNAK